MCLKHPQGVVSTASSESACDFFESDLCTCGSSGRTHKREAVTEQNSYIYIYEFYTVIQCQKVVSINDVKARNSSATLLTATLNVCGDKQSSGKRYKRS